MKKNKKNAKDRKKDTQTTIDSPYAFILDGSNRKVVIPNSTDETDEEDVPER